MVTQTVPLCWKVVSCTSLEAVGSQTSILSTVLWSIMERCGLENIFLLLFWSSYSKHWAKPVKLGSVLQLFWEPEQGIAALCPIPMDRLVLLTPVLTQVTKVLVKEVRMNAGAPWEHCQLGIKAVLRLPCSSWEKHSGQAHGRLFAFPLLFPQTC